MAVILVVTAAGILSGFIAGAIAIAAAGATMQSQQKPGL